MRLGVFRKPITAFHLLLRRLSSMLDYIIWILFDPSKFKIIKNRKIKNILVVLINQELGNVGGDFVTLGVLSYFKQIYPDVKVSVLSDKRTISQFDNFPNIDFIEYKDKQTIHQIRDMDFQALISMNLGSANIKDFLFIPYRISKTASSTKNLLKFRNRFLFTRKIFNCSIHMVDLRFKLLEKLGFRFKNKRLIFYYSKGDEKKVTKFLKNKKIKKYIIIHPGGKYVVDIFKQGKVPPHLWSLERYAKVADYFLDKGYKILITGSKSESILAKEIIRYSKNKKNIMDTCGKFSLRELGVLLKKSKLLIATDTSIVHIAYQLDIPIVELMGPSLPEIVGAWPTNKNTHKILVDKGRCSRTMRKKACPENIPCLNNITINQVINASEKLL